MAAREPDTNTTDPPTLNTTDSDWVRDIVSQSSKRKNEGKPNTDSNKSIYPIVNRLSTNPAYKPDGTQPEIPKNLRQITTAYTSSNVESIKSSLSQIFEGRKHAVQEIAGIYIDIDLCKIVDPSQTSDHEYMTLGTQQSTTDIITEAYPQAARALLEIAMALVASVMKDKHDPKYAARELSGEFMELGTAEEKGDDTKKKPNATATKRVTRGAVNQDRERTKRATDTAKKAKRNSQGTRVSNNITATATGEDVGSFDDVLSPTALEAFKQTHCGKKLTEEKIHQLMDGMTIEEQDDATYEIVAEAILSSANFDPAAIPELGEKDGKERFELALQIMMSALISIQEADYLATEENKTDEEPRPPNAPRPTMTTETDRGKPQRTVGTAMQAGQDSRGALKSQRTVETAEQAG